MLGGADKSNGDLGTYITGADIFEKFPLMERRLSVQAAQSQMMTFAPHASISTIALGTSAPACCQVAGVTTGLQNWMQTATALPVAAMSVKNRLINMAH